jgi:hypothetical protein
VRIGGHGSDARGRESRRVCHRLARGAVRQPETVEYHLGKTLCKLGATSRAELARRVVQLGAGAEPPRAV